ncbi:alpha/beta hydrolase fold [Enhydrobacter aerosaccus]|uniref:Alpha/beta hydrolase fold n=2 Tax=Enhydrobacter aerosaccus TaxID=225324 RepID=A0A1T4R9D4_9HYPH|nr:alpha/beta hydrolase fold [Enhydrobacter aerosaccus]
MFFWPLIAASELVAAQASGFARIMTAAAYPSSVPSDEAPWSTTNHVRLDLPTMRLRDFSSGGDGTATLVCAPFALHEANVADFAPGHSLVETLLHGGCHHLLVTDWRSATKDMRLLSLDNYLADLNVAIDEIGAPVDLVGLCQGGVMALIYAARFPNKVRKLVLAGAPIDTDAGSSLFSATARALPLSALDEVANLGDGRMLGRRVLDVLRPTLIGTEGLQALQLQGDEAEAESLMERFSAWYDRTVNLPGVYYHQLLLWLFKENRLVEGNFPALGREIDLADVRHPLFLLAARDDEFVAPQQLLNAARLVSSEVVEEMTEPCSHLALFMGHAVLNDAWRRIARWLRQDGAA